VEVLKLFTSEQNNARDPAVPSVSTRTQPHTKTHQINYVQVLCVSFLRTKNIPTCHLVSYLHRETSLYLDSIAYLNRLCCSSIDYKRVVSTIRLHSSYSEQDTSILCPPITMVNRLEVSYRNLSFQNPASLFQPPL